MNMKEHILEALREQFERWETALAALSEEQIRAPNFDLHWSVKDVLAHLWAWQQISIARMEAGTLDRAPVYQAWIDRLGENWEDDADRVNALTFENNHTKPWTEVHQNWRNGFQRFLELGNQISERDLLDGSRYSWLGYPLASILVASYEHHQEHFDKMLDWKKKYEN